MALEKSRDDESVEGDSTTTSPGALGCCLMWEIGEPVYGFNVSACDGSLNMDVLPVLRASRGLSSSERKV